MDIEFTFKSSRLLHNHHMKMLQRKTTGIQGMCLGTYEHTGSFVCFLGIKSKPFKVGV